MKRLLLVPYTFVLLNWAAVKALYCFLRGAELQSLWGGGARHDVDAHRSALRP
jgi:hypothetical protein